MSVRGDGRGGGGGGGGGGEGRGRATACDINLIARTMEAGRVPTRRRAALRRRTYAPPYTAQQRAKAWGSSPAPYIVAMKAVCVSGKRPRHSM
eukprot:COSAG01_NODE_5408_length_4281_cov_11.199904_6_plen_93_part_00